MKIFGKFLTFSAIGILIALQSLAQIPSVPLEKSQPENPSAETQTETADGWTQYIPIKDINAIATSGNWEVNIYRGKNEMIKFLAPKDAVSQNGDILFLTGGGTNQTRYRADVMLPDLNMINVNGNTLLYCKDFLVNNLSIKSSGVATIIGIHNYIYNLKLIVDGVAQVDFADSKTRNIFLDMSGTNKTLLNIVDGGALTGTIRGNSAVRYFGNVGKQTLLVREGASAEKIEAPKTVKKDKK